MKIRLLLLSAALLSYNVSFGRDCDGGLSPEVTETEITATGHEAPPAAPANIEPDAFRISSIDSALFARIDGRSYKKGCRIPPSELRYLTVLHIGFDGATHRGEMICNRAIADDLLEIFRTLYKACYPIARMVLIDEYAADDTQSMEANNSSAFNYREIRNTGKLSAHSYGYAVDINPLFNPCVIVRNGQTTVDPEAGAPYADRTRVFVGKIDHDDLCYKEFRKHGFIWGGDWKSLKDYQHFEKPVESAHQ